MLKNYHKYVFHGLIGHRCCRDLTLMVKDKKRRQVSSFITKKNDLVGQHKKMSDKCLLIVPVEMIFSQVCQSRIDKIS